MDNNTSATGLMPPTIQDNSKHIGRDNFDNESDIQKDTEKSLADKNL